MLQRVRGVVRYANGFAAGGIDVSVWDLDQDPEKNDLLSTGEVLTRPDGSFEVEFDPDRYQDVKRSFSTEPRNPPSDWTLVTREYLLPDPNDHYLPFLRFKYPFQDQVRTLDILLSAWKGLAILPADLNRTFLPSRDGWHFPNLFSGYSLPFSLPALPGVNSIDSVYGLCGGMCAAALDHFLANQPLPRNRKAPETGTDLQKYLFYRQLQSFGRLGYVIGKFHSWMSLPDEQSYGTQKRSWDEFAARIRPRLNHHQPTPLGLLYVKWKHSRNISLNHQVLATALEKTSSDSWSISLYDPNYPDRDDIRLRLEKTFLSHKLAGLRIAQQIGRQNRAVYGFFSIPYTFAPPPLSFS